MLFLVFLLNIVFGLAFPLGKAAVNLANPFFAVGLRMFIASLALISFIGIRHRWKCIPRITEWHLFIQATFFMSIMPNILRFWALQYVSVVKSALLFNIAPFATALWAYLFFHETITLRQCCGLIIGFCGMIPLILIHGIQEGSEFLSLSLPELAIIAGVSCMGYGLLINQKLIKHHGCPPYLINAISMFFGGISILGIAFFQDTTLVYGDSLIFSLLIAAHILTSNIIGAHLQGYLLQHYSSTFISFSGFLSPLCGAVYGWLFFKEHLDWHVGFSSLLVIAGLWLFYYDHHSKTTISLTR